MNPENPSWEKLVAVARLARDDRREEAPYGFATRVVAQAMANQVQAKSTLFERWAWRAVAIAGMFATVTVAANYTTFTSPPDYDLLSDDTAMAAIFD
jgi:hypothetical protein